VYILVKCYVLPLNITELTSTKHKRKLMSLMYVHVSIGVKLSHHFVRLYPTSPLSLNSSTKVIQQLKMLNYFNSLSSSVMPPYTAQTTRMVLEMVKRRERREGRQGRKNGGTHFGSNGHTSIAGYLPKNRRLYAINLNSIQASCCKKTAHAEFYQNVIGLLVCM